MKKKDFYLNYSISFEIRGTGEIIIKPNRKPVIQVNEQLLCGEKEIGYSKQFRLDEISARKAIEIRRRYFTDHLEEQFSHAFAMLQQEADGFSEFILGSNSQAVNQPFDEKFFRGRTEFQKTKAKSKRKEIIRELEKLAERRFREAIKSHLRERYREIKESVAILVWQYKSARKRFLKRKLKGVTDQEWQRDWMYLARIGGAAHPNFVFELMFNGKSTAEIARYLLGLELGYEPNTVANELKPARIKEPKERTKKT